MGIIETKAFVMNSFPWKDRHRILHLLTPELGLITAMAPGSESLRSELRGVTQLFSLSDFMLASQQSRYTVKSGCVIESFTAVSQDLDRLAAASHAAEVFADVARNDEPQRRVYDLWAYTIHEISVSEDPVFIARMGTMRLMEEIGLAPCLDVCVCCKGVVSQPWHFSYREGGLICGREMFRDPAQAAITLTMGAVDLLRHILMVPLPKLYRFQATPATRVEASCLADRWIEEKMEKRYKRLSLLDQCPDFSSLKNRHACEE
ncbi:MAG TPA: DNA repair protein RecO [Clostridia bacterium]|nr:DNA repair protein RecO [Clostridia bacterium]